jgi:hypothetical protein
MHVIHVGKHILSWADASVSITENLRNKLQALDLQLRASLDTDSNHVNLVWEKDKHLSLTREDALLFRQLLARRKDAKVTCLQREATGDTRSWTLSRWRAWLAGQLPGDPQPSARNNAIDLRVNKPNECPLVTFTLFGKADDGATHMRLCGVLDMYSYDKPVLIFESPEGSKPVTFSQFRDFLDGLKDNRQAHERSVHVEPLLGDKGHPLPPGPLPPGPLRRLVSPNGNLDMHALTQFAYEHVHLLQPQHLRPQTVHARRTSSKAMAVAEKIWADLQKIGKYQAILAAYLKRHPEVLEWITDPARMRELSMARTRAAPKARRPTNWL